MPPKTTPKTNPRKAPKKTPKIYKDKNGNRYVIIKGKHVMIKPDVSDRDFIMWLVKQLRPKKRKPRKKKVETPKVRDFEGEITSGLTDNPSLLNYYNTERKREDKPLLIAGPYP